MRNLLLSLILALSLPAWAATSTRVSSFEYDPSTGLLVKESIEPDTANVQYRLDTVYTYDAFGNRKTATVSSPATGTAAIVTRATSTTYDATGQFPIAVSNALSHSETKTFDARFGTVASLTGPNGLATSWQYDGFGRKTRETRADGTYTQWTYDVCDAACPANGVYRIVTQVFSGTLQTAPVAVAYFDSLNRKLRSATQGFNGSWIYTDTEYDNLGRVQKVSRPYFAGQLVCWVTNEYDDLGRVIKVYEPDDPSTPTLSVAYNGLTVSRTNRKGQTTTEVQNSQGQKVSVTDAMGNITTYAYDPFGNLTRTTDPAGNQIVNVYDLRGRKTQTTDPDLGLWKYEYNALGELVKQIDAKNQVSSMSYDKLGRMIQRVENGLTSDWIYDTAPTRGKGKLYQAKTSAGYIRTHYYDNLGRPQSTLSNLGAGNPLLYTNFVYDTAGRVSQHAYSSGFATKQVYNIYGYVSEVRNANSNALYWRADAMDAEGHLTKETYGNGIVTDRSYYADTGRVQNITASAAKGEQVQGQAYVYDTIGNVSIYADGPGSQMEIRGGYDALNRLTQIDSTINGVASSQVLVYDVLGNISSKTGVGSYYYGGNANCINSNVGRHAVCRAGNNAYSYDANGNLTGGGGRALTWTAWNMPSSLTQGGVTTSWLYGPEHDRYKMVATGRTTWYLNPSVHQGGHYERTQYTSGTVEHRHTLYGGGRAIGEVLTFEVSSGTAPAAQTRYFHSDQQGSITAVTNSAGVVLTRFRYDPWGKQTLIYGSNTGISQTRQGHTSHEMLDGGLTHMNGRLYDPVLSRFVSADPYIQSPYDLQSFNRYSYVFNNPMGNTDPTGYWSLKSFAKATLKFNLFPTPKNSFEFVRNQPGQQNVDRYIMSHPWAYSVGQAAATYFTAICGGCGGAAWSAYYGYVATGSVNSALRTGAITYVTTYAFNYVDGAAGLNTAEKIIAKSFVGGVSAELQGGSFSNGFLNSFATSSAAWAYKSVVGQGPNPRTATGKYSENGTYPVEEFSKVVDKNSNAFGANDALSKTGNAIEDFVSNIGKQEGFISNLLAYNVPLANAVAFLHDKWWNSVNGVPTTYFGVGFNPVTNFGTMLPAAVITAGAFLADSYVGPVLKWSDK